MFSEKMIGIRLFLQKSYPFSLVLASLIALIVFYGRTITQNFYYIFMLLPFLLALGPLEWKRLSQNVVLRAFAAYLLALWLSLVWNGHSSFMSGVSFARDLLVEFAFVSFIAWQLSRNRKDNEAIITVSFGLVIVVACILALWAFRSHIGLAGERMSLMMWSNPNTGAAVCGVGAVLLINIWLRCRNYSGLIIITMMFLVLVVAVFLSGSRAAFAGIFMSLVTSIAAQRSWRLIWIFVVAIVAIITIGVSTGVISPVQSIARGDSARFAVWSFFLDPILENFWRGIGIDRQFALSFDVGGMRIDNPHNMFLVSLLYGGILSLVAWIALLGAMAKVSYLAARDQSDVLALGLAAFLFIHGLFEGILLVELTGWQWIYFLLPLGCIAGIALPGGRFDDSTEQIADPALFASRSAGSSTAGI